MKTGKRIWILRSVMMAIAIATGKAAGGADGQVVCDTMKDVNGDWPPSVMD